MNLLKSWKKSYRQRVCQCQPSCGQTGHDKKNEQVGTYHFQNAYNLAAMAKKYGVGLKEHNADYLDDVNTFRAHTGKCDRKQCCAAVWYRGNKSLSEAV